MKLMVCYDGTRLAKEALALARKHAKAFEASLYVVTSLEKAAEDPMAGEVAGAGSSVAEDKSGDPKTSAYLRAK